MAEQLKKLVAIAFVLGLMGVLANLLVDNPYSHRVVRQLANAAIEEKTGYSIEFSAMKISIVPPQVTAYRFQLFEADNHVIPVVEASQVKVRVSLLSLFLVSFVRFEPIIYSLHRSILSASTMFRPIHSAI